MSNRIQLFKSYRDHPWLRKTYSKLDENDLKIAVSFINENDGLSRGQFEIKLNRMFLDKEKPKKWTHISELLICCNSGSDAS